MNLFLWTITYNKFLTTLSAWKTIRYKEKHEKGLESYANKKNLTHQALICMASLNLAKSLPWLGVLETLQERLG